MDTRVPYAPRVSAKAAGAIAVGWGAASSLIDELRRLCFADGGWTWVGIAALSLALRCALGPYAFGARSRRAATARLALGYLLLSAALVATRGWPGPFMALGYGLTSPLWLAFAALLVYPIWKYSDAGSQEDADRAQVAAAGWVALPTVTVLVATRAVPWPSGTMLLPATLDIGLPLVVATFAVARIWSRRHWLTSVASGKHPRWRIIDEPAAAVALPALVRATASGADRKVLVRVHAAEQPFRDVERLEAVGIVAGTPTR